MSQLLRGNLIIASIAKVKHELLLLLLLCALFIFIFVHFTVKRGSSLSSSVPRFTSPETVSSNFYLNGTWPRVGHALHAPLDQAEDAVDVDKETQVNTELSSRQSENQVPGFSRSF